MLLQPDSLSSAALSRDHRCTSVDASASVTLDPIAPLWSLVPPVGDTFLIRPPLQGDEMRRKKKQRT